MFYTFDVSYYPIVLITFNKYKINDNDFRNFLSDWLKLYTFRKNFMLIFDTRKMLFPHFKYSLKIMAFIKKLRKYHPQYLNRSIIIVQNKKISNLLEFIFYIQPPVAPVYLTKEKISNILYKIKTINNYNDLKELNNLESLKLTSINIIKKIKPKKPLLPFL